MIFFLNKVMLKFIRMYMYFIFKYFYYNLINWMKGKKFSVFLWILIKIYYLLVYFIIYNFKIIRV